MFSITAPCGMLHVSTKHTGFIVPDFRLQAHIPKGVSMNGNISTVDDVSANTNTGGWPYSLCMDIP